MLTIANKRNLLSNRLNSNQILCDRRSSLGNPFLLSNESERDLICEAYEFYFYTILKNRIQPVAAAEITVKKYQVKIASTWLIPSIQEFITELLRIKNKLDTNQDVELICWCHPLRCHLQTIVDYFSTNN